MFASFSVALPIKEWEAAREMRGVLFSAETYTARLNADAYADLGDDANFERLVGSMGEEFCFKCYKLRYSPLVLYITPLPISFSLALSLTLTLQTPLSCIYSPLIFNINMSVYRATPEFVSVYEVALQQLKSWTEYRLLPKIDEAMKLLEPDEL